MPVIGSSVPSTDWRTAFRAHAKLDGPIAAMLIERFPPPAGLASVYNERLPSILRCMV
jgi:hypothetical protein